MPTALRMEEVAKSVLRRPSAHDYEHEVVDGQQRLKAIWKFLENRFALGEESTDLPQGDLKGARLSDLDTEAEDKLFGYQISVVIVEEASDLEIRDLFSRLQEGITLTPPLSGETPCQGRCETSSQI